MRENETVRVISFRKAHIDEWNIFNSLTGYNKSLNQIGAKTAPPG